MRIVFERWDVKTGLRVRKNGKPWIVSETGNKGDCRGPTFHLVCLATGESRSLGNRDDAAEFLTSEEWDVEK